MSGYLKPVEKKVAKGRIICRLAIPNEEVRRIYEDTVSGWFEERGLEDNGYHKMLECLAAGDIARFEKYLQEVVLATFSYFDITESDLFSNSKKSTRSSAKNSKPPATRR